MRRILLLGYFGAGNFGDDALLVEWLMRHYAWLEANSLHVDVVSRSQTPLDDFAEGQRLMGRVNACISPWQALLIGPSRYCALVAPGGSMLQDVTSLRSLIFYLYLLQRFQRSRTPVYLLNQGLGPFRRSLLLPWIAGTLAQCELLTLRDEQSLQWAEEQPGLAASGRLQLGADPVVRASFEHLPLDLPERAYSLIIPKADSTRSSQQLRELCEVCVTLEECGLRVLLTSLQAGRDHELAQAVAAAMPSTQYVEPAAPRGNAVWTLIARSALVVSYRLHGLVAAAASLVPAWGVVYDPKVAAFCEQLGLRYCSQELVAEPESLGRLRMLALTLEQARLTLKPRLERSAKLAEAAEQRFIVDLTSQLLRRS